MNSEDIMTPVGRIVAGNPLEHRQKVDQQTRQPRVSPTTGAIMTETYFGLAIPKQGEANWWETPWGAQILAVAQRDWPNGEHQNPAFAWKIVNGDDTVPNQAGKKPCDQEGYPGHWVLNCSTGIPVRCYRSGQFEAHQVLQPEAKEIKTGDYGRTVLNVCGNGAQPPAKPGLFMNPTLFELVQTGPLIVTGSGPDPHEAFSQPPTMPANALPDPTGGTGAPPPTGAADGTPPAASVPPGGNPPPASTAPPVAGAPGTGAPSMPPPAVQPAADFLNPDERRLDPNGNAFTVAQLKAANWTDEQIKAAPLAQ